MGFQRIATTVVERLAELLGGQVWVWDSQGEIVAQSHGRSAGSAPSSIAPLALETETMTLRVPITLDGQTGEVVIRMPANGEVVSPRLARVLIDLIIHQAAVVRLPNQHELKNKFIHDLLREPVSDEASILRQAQILGMDLTRPRSVILIDAADYILAPSSSRCLETTNAQIWRRVQIIISSIVNFFQLPSDTICAYIGDGEVAVLKASSTQDLVAWTACEDMPDQSSPSWANLTALKRAGVALLTHLRSDTCASLCIGIGRYHPGLQGLTRSYQDACAALSLGRRLGRQNQVHCLDELGIAAFVGVSDERTKVELARHLLSPLDQEPELLETLDSFFLENCYPTPTANRLVIHRNTLSYRLDKITSLTGLDPRRFDEAMQIRLALLLRSLEGDVMPLGKCPIPKSRQSRHLRQMPDVSCG